jgi:FkbM family methyltransferase
LSHRVVLRRRLPAQFGGDRLFVSPDAALRYWRWDLGKTSKDLFEFAERFVKQGDVVWDVGANVGIFAFASAYRAGSTGQVVAIECDTFLVDLLRRSARARSNGAANVTVVPAAVTDAVGLADFQIAVRGRSTNHLASTVGSTQTGGVRETVSVLTISLDWLIQHLPPPNVLKIDTEGAETKILQGAKSLIATTRPTILCEISSEECESSTAILHAHGYHLYDFDDPTRGRLTGAAFNTLAIHSTKDTI